MFTEKLAYNRLVDHLKKCGLFSDFRYGFRSSRLTADFLTFVSDGIARVFNRPGATGPVALDISKVFDRVGMLLLYLNLSLMKFQVRYLPFLRLFSAIDGFKRIQTILRRISS